MRMLPPSSLTDPVAIPQTPRDCGRERRGFVCALHETNLRREFQLEGIAKAKAAGVYRGHPASIDAAQVRAMKAQGLGHRKS
jgi:hypothetical protein